MINGCQGDGGRECSYLKDKAVLFLCVCIFFNLFFFNIVVVFVIH